MTTHTHTHTHTKHKYRQTRRTDKTNALIHFFLKISCIVQNISMDTHTQAKSTLQIHHLPTANTPTYFRKTMIQPLQVYASLTKRIREQKNICIFSHNKTPLNKCEGKESKQIKIKTQRNIITYFFSLNLFDGYSCDYFFHVNKFLNS